MAEDIRVFAEAFAVVGNDDQPGVFENAASVERVDQFTDLFVEIGDAVVVGVGSELDAGG